MKKTLENKKILVLLFRAHDRLVLDESFVFSVNNSPKNTPLALLPYENSRNSQYDTQYIILTCEYTGLLRLLLQVPKTVRGTYVVYCAAYMFRCTSRLGAGKAPHSLSFLSFLVFFFFCFPFQYFRRPIMCWPSPLLTIGCCSTCFVHTRC